MHIDIPHELEPEDAVARLDRYLEDLLTRSLPAGIVVRDVSRDWTDRTMHFAFTAKKGFLGASLDGSLEVQDDRVSIDADLPGLVTAFMDEGRIGDVVRRELGTVLASGSH